MSGDLILYVVFMESSSQKDKKHTTLYFLFSSCFSAQQYFMVVFNMSKAIFSPS